MIENDLEVLVAGAGPTGLVLALVLARLGARVRVVDAAPGPGTTSRALAVQARTLELYASLDLADEVVRRGLAVRAANLWRFGERAARVELSAIGAGLSPYPFALIFPQDEHEALLVERLAAAGVTVERRSEVVSLTRHEDRVVATLRGPNGERSEVEARYLAGCDGARSTVRGAIGVDFDGTTYQHLFYVADIEGEGPVMDQELHVLLDEAGFLALFPLAGVGRARLIGTIDDRATAGEKEHGWDDIDRGPVERAGLDVRKVNWFSTYHVHHRVAGAFRRGHVFLLGDAAHIHSPLGGQGMNTGIGDAVNLGWKLAAVLGGRARADLLDTYEPERIAFARRLVATTDRAFQAVTSESELAAFTRTKLVPPLVARAARTRLGRRLLFRAVSQTGIAYRDSAWSEGRAGAVHAGDRLPWVAPAPGSVDNFEALRRFDWQVHLYGAAPPSWLSALAEARRLPLVVRPASEAGRRAELDGDHLYLVRPDGYLGLIAALGDGETPLRDYLDRHGVVSR